MASLLALAAIQTAAAPQGAVGPLYPVIEPDMLDAIEGAVAAAKEDGTSGRMRERAREGALAYVRRPAPVAGLRRAQASTDVLFDPSITIARPVVSASGAVIHPAGTRVNPLEHVSLTRRLVLFDADDPWQADLAAGLVREETPTVAVLVGGSPEAFARASGARAYFDQGGRISGRLRITEVPAVVEQQGLMLRIRTLAQDGPRQ